MKIKIIIGLAMILLLTACSQTVAKEESTIHKLKYEDDYFENITVFEDTEYDVVCWTVKAGYGAGISCIPKEELNIK